jgi:SAM-dependent methyltransferase
MLNPLKELIFSLLPTEMRFERIHAKNRWSSEESISGQGSELAATEALRIALPQLFRELKIERVLDAPCGDFNWMRHVIREAPVHYIGMDIVHDLIDRNHDLYGSETVKFLHGNIITGPVPQADLIICRDCFIHLSFRDTARAIENFKDSNSRYLLTNSYPAIKQNEDITTGRWRFINLSVPPYSYPTPRIKIEETEAGKEMWLWELAQL